MAMSRVPGDDELFVGGIFTLRRRGALEELGITHVVSVLKYDFKDFQGWEKYEHCSIPVDDVDDENLLESFPKTNEFIGNALKNGGKVLVHCAMGKSRSVTIVLAYLLSTRRHLNLQSALELVREARPIAEPNDGFMAQLAVYESMGYPKDLDAHPAYQRWLYQKDVELSVAIGRAPDRLRFEDEEDQTLPDMSDLSLAETKTADASAEKELRCRKCRRTLATRQYLIPHDPKPKRPAGEVDYSPISSLPNPQAAPTSSLDAACTHHFIQPLSWMRPELEKSELSGRLECPNVKCKQLIGRYTWQGMRCSCGEWIVPAFSLQAGRVDEVIKRPGATGVRMPPGATPAPGGTRLPPGLRTPAAASGGKGNL